MIEILNVIDWRSAKTLRRHETYKAGLELFKKLRLEGEYPGLCYSMSHCLPGAPDISCDALMKNYYPELYETRPVNAGNWWWPRDIEFPRLAAFKYAIEKTARKPFPFKKQR